MEWCEVEDSVVAVGQGRVGLLACLSYIGMDAFQEVGVAAEMAARSTAPYFGADEDHRLLLAATYQK